MEINGKHILVVGLGRTGMAVARFLHRRGARVSVSDAAPESAHSDVLAEIRGLADTVELGGHRIETFVAVDTIVLSPGVPHTLPELEAARRRGIGVIGEIELSSRFIEDPIIAVTGTNGKTTTTELLGRMLAASKIPAFVGGNIGNPLIGYLDEPRKAVLVVEVSSFQLDTADTFHPAVGVLLNIAEDHLDRYPDMGAYAASKGRLFRCQGPEDTAVLNGSDRRVRQIADTVRSRKLVYVRRLSEFAAAGEGAAIDPQRIVLSTRECRRAEIPRDLLRLPGDYNAENAAAAALAALTAGATVDGITGALTSFSGLPHRTEHVATIDGIRFINDSKATNVAAVLRALESLQAPVVLILGGRDKGADFTRLAAPVRARATHVVVLGEARDAIRSALNGTTTIRSATDMGEAVHLAARAARSGDVVLLSPGCASFDQYGSYAERGEDFCRHVRQLSRTGTGA